MRASYRGPDAQNTSYINDSRIVQGNYFLAGTSEVPDCIYSQSEVQMIEKLQAHFKMKIV